MADSFEVGAGFLPLLDACIPIAAHEKGLAEEEGILLRLVRETSWANIRDRMAVGHFQVAHMLAPMPIAARLGLTPMPLDIVAPMALGLGGNAVTVSRDLFAQMEGADRPLDPRQAGRALGHALGRRRSDGLPPPKFAVVHPFSGHNYDLRYWLAACGIDPERDVEIVVVPPPLMPEALARGRIDGFCVGEPWSSVAVADGSGVVVTGKSAIWRHSPEKVLGVSTGFAEREPEILAALLRALFRAARWCGDPANHGELASLLARRTYIGRPAEHILPALAGRLPLGDGAVLADDDFFVPFARHATFPWKSHALWFFTQMVRWNQAAWSRKNAMAAAATYRPDLYRLALAPMGAALPAADGKAEGGPQGPARSGGAAEEEGGFFDGRRFDPQAVETYMAAQKPKPGF